MRKCVVSLASLVVFVMVGITYGAPFGLYDDFSTESNTNWTVTEGTGVVDLHAYYNKKDEYPYNSSVFYHEGEFAYRSSGSGSPYAGMKASMPDSDGASVYHVALDFKYREDWSGSWSERLFVGNQSADNYIYVELFQSHKSRDGNRYFVGVNTGNGDVDKYASTPANLGDWFHYDIMIENGTATVKRWDIGYHRAEHPYPYVPSGSPLDTVSFPFSFSPSGNNLAFQSYGKDQMTFLDEVYFGVPEPATCTLLLTTGVFSLFTRKLR